MNDSYHPYTLTVDFPDGMPSVTRVYNEGANRATFMMWKAINFYTEKQMQCTIFLHDHSGALIAKQQVPDEKINETTSTDTGRPGED